MVSAQSSTAIKSDPAIEGSDNRQRPSTVPEIKTMLKIIAAIGWLNLLIGLPSVLLVLNLKSLSLVGTGVLSIFTFWLLRMTVRQISQSKSWAEVGVLAMCGVYFPLFIVWICGLNLVEAIMR